MLYLNPINTSASQVRLDKLVDSEDIFERIMRFLNRYAEENGFEFQAT